MTYDFSMLDIASVSAATPTTLRLLETQGGVDFGFFEVELATFAMLVQTARQISPRAAPQVELLYTSLSTLVTATLALRDDAITENWRCTESAGAWWTVLIPGYRTRLRTNAQQTRLVELGTDDVLDATNALRNLLTEHGQPAGFLNTTVCDALYTATTNLQNVLAQR